MRMLTFSLALLLLGAAALAEDELPPAPPADAATELSPEDEHPPLLTAAQAGDAEACRRLLSEGASVEVEPRSTTSPLMAAAYAGHADVCRLLLKAGAKINNIDPLGNTPLHYALAGRMAGVSTEEACSQVVSVLMKAGAELSMSNDDEETPIDFAADLENISILQQLLDSMPREGH